MKKKKQQGSCESCMYYEYDEDYECYVCEVNLDEDEMARFMGTVSMTVPITGWAMNT